ncbi:polyprenyl synthetase family protein [Candidatus Woesearchaeota archaeon]|nr:polyprenyl synthetase family protein [Candidatus Woesearchaeota archaeon]
MVNDIKRILQDYKQKIDAQLTLFFDEIIKQTPSQNLTKPFLESIKTFTLSGGKRLRPIFFIYGYKAVKYENPEVIKASLCAELLESFFLIHDDIMDHSAVRRGKPSFHIQHGVNKAILAGDTLVSIASLPLLQTSFLNKELAIEKLHEIMYVTNIGQLYDLEFSAKSFDELTEEEIMQGYLLKTAHYSVEGPLLLGALLACANENQCQTLSGYGIKVGQAFQLVDDILGVFGDEKTLGKSVYSDIEEGKRTLLMFKTYQQASPSDKQFLTSCLGKNINQEEFNHIKEIIINTEALDYCKQLINELINGANDIIKSSTLWEKDFFIGISKYILERTH